ncbi:MAG: DUF3849 domain-containing protein, partial [Firmicutes bacterium]|nr:DUF3849 domain-containing protein [Bacillota bacterium]
VIETAISRYEEKNGVKPSFFISVDNDEAGHKFNQKYSKNVYDITTTSIFKELGDSKIKDWNELLQAVTEKEKTQSISYLPDDSMEYSKFIFDEGIRDKNLRLIYKNSADTYMMNYFTKDDITKAKNTAKTGNEFFKLLIDSSVKNEVEEGTFYYMGADNAYGRDNHIFSGLNAETMKGLIDFADNGILNIPEKETNNSGEIPSKEEMIKYLLWLGSNKRMSKRNILEGFSHLDTIEEKAEFIRREYTIKGLNDKSEKMKFSIGDKKYEWTWAELAASAEKMIAEHNYLTNKDIEKLGLITVDEVKEITKKAEDVKKYIAEINKAVTNEKSYIPLYTNSAEYARENGEIDDYRASNRENERCNKYISENYGEYHNASTYIFDRDSFANNIISEFGLERATAVIAGYINENDGRYTRECKAEANKYKLPKQYYTNMHPTLINSLFERFIDLNREKTKEMSQEPINQTIDNSDKYKSLLTIDEEKAIEIFTKSDLPIYLIYDDNTNAIAHSEEEIENHSGTFGISKDDFEKYNSEAEKISETEDISDNTDVKEETKKEAKEEVKKSEAKQKESTINEELINGIPKEIVLAALKTGTGYVDGKFRVEKIILGELDVKERIKKIKKEFGFGGRNGEFGNSSIKWISYDPTAYFIEWENANGKTKGKLSWSEVEKNLNQLVRNNQYVTPEERLKYEQKNYVNTKIGYLKDGDRISVNGDKFTFLHKDDMGNIFVIPDNPNSPILNSRPNGEYFINAFMLHRYDFEVVNGDIPKSADKNISYGSNNYKFFRGE